MSKIIKILDWLFYDEYYEAKENHLRFQLECLIDELRNTYKNTK